MAALTAGPVALDMLAASIDTYGFLTFTVRTDSSLVGDYRALGDPNYVVTLIGQGFTYGVSALPVTGTVNAIVEQSGATTVFGVSGIAAPAATFQDWVNTGNTTAAYSSLFSGHDVFLGSVEGDVLKGFGGNDYIDGREGQDTAVYAQPESQYHLVGYHGSTVVIPVTLGSPAASDGIDRLFNVENVAFSNGASIRPISAAVDEPSFKGLNYIASYSDLMAAFGANEEAGFGHYVSGGFYEGRGTTFSGLEYSASYNDIYAAFGLDSDAAARHYIAHGRPVEGRTVTFNGLEYIASYSDLMAVFNTDVDAGARHWLVQGSPAEGRSVTFSGLEYIASYGDLISAFGANADAGATHYILHGYPVEGRSETFDPVQYVANYADLQTAFGTNYAAATQHFIQAGYFEGRTDDPLS